MCLYRYACMSLFSYTCINSWITRICIHCLRDLQLLKSVKSVSFTRPQLMSTFYASAQRNVAVGIIVLSCSSVRAYVHPSVRASVCASRNIVNTISCRVFDTFSPNLHQRCVMGQRWTLHNLGSEGQRWRSRWNKVCWKQHFLALLTRCLEKY